jgi:hypothetical protein
VASVISRGLAGAFRVATEGPDRPWRPQRSPRHTRTHVPDGSRGGAIRDFSLFARWSDGSDVLFGVTSCWNAPRNARSTGMEPSTDTEIKLHIGYALSDRLACAIQQNITRSVKLIDELPSAAIEALLDYSREQHRLDRPRTPVERAYKDVRRKAGPNHTYGEAALREARERERHMLHGITGRHIRVE